MALVLPALRLWLLLLNIYRTFKAMKPPPQAQRSARNKSGPSARAMQLRKRELKSCLAVWVVWSIFSTIETLLDRTVGLITPFYNELKCLVVLFLLVTRAHGAEAIFLHFIHPLLRPYVPAIDDVLENLHLVLELCLLLLFLPLEYISHLWQKWSWNKRPSDSGDDSPGDDGAGDGGESLQEERRVLRPRNTSQQLKMREADRLAQAVLQDIDDAQDRVRDRARNQPIPPPAWNDRRNPLNRGGKDAELHATAVGFRTRKRILEYPPTEEQQRTPGSSTTGVHHVYRTALNELPPVPSLQPFPALPAPPTTQPIELPSNPLPIAPQLSIGPHEIWLPSRSAFEGDRRTPPEAIPRKTPSPVYPPLPSAYPFTPRLSNPLPPPPRIITAPSLVAPTPRRVSTGTTPARTALVGPERAHRHPGRTNQTRPTRTARSADPPGPRDHARPEHMQAEDFFGRALETSIQAAEVDMDTETISTRDGSSANEDIEMEAEASRENMAKIAGGGALMGRRGLRSMRKVDSAVKQNKRKATTLAEPLRRSTRRRDRSSSIEIDEFGFTIRPGGSTIRRKTTVSLPVTGSSKSGPSRKKPLARTKPALKAVQGGNDETETSDEESEKKRQRLSSVIDEDSTSGAYEDAESNSRVTDQDEYKSIPPLEPGGRGKRSTGVQEAGESHAPRKSKQTGTHPNRATRASARLPVSAREDRLPFAGVTKTRRT